MPGMKCPICGELTFYKTPTGRECRKCGGEMWVPAPTPGKGKRCTNCGKHKEH